MTGPTKHAGSKIELMSDTKFTFRFCRNSLIMKPNFKGVCNW